MTIVLYVVVGVLMLSAAVLIRGTWRLCDEIKDADERWWADYRQKELEQVVWLWNHPNQPLGRELAMNSYIRHRQDLWLAAISGRSWPNN